MTYNDDIRTNEHFPSEVNAPARSDIELILRNYGINTVSYIQLIDSTRNADDIRLNYIIDKKYVLRFCNDPAITENRLSELNRLVGRYHDAGIVCPGFIAQKNGKYLHDKTPLKYYLSEFIDLRLASEVNLKDAKSLEKEITDSVAMFAERYRNIDLSSTFGMYSLFDLAPYDKEIGIDEKEDNFNELIVCLHEISQNDLANRLNTRHKDVREKIKAIYTDLPRCVFQADENFSNVLIDNNEHFVGFIDFNMAGTEVVVNQLANLAGFDFDEENHSPAGALNRLNRAVTSYRENAERMLRIYHAEEEERQAMPLYAWIVMVCQWPIFCFFRNGLKNNELRDEITELLSMIADLPEDRLFV